MIGDTACRNTDTKILSGDAGLMKGERCELQHRESEEMGEIGKRRA